jgi:hypothetical protein
VENDTNLKTFITLKVEIFFRKEKINSLKLRNLSVSEDTWYLEERVAAPVKKT